VASVFSAGENISLFQIVTKQNMLFVTYGGSVILISEFHETLTRINKNAKKTRQKYALG
jgi:hypothetical protein